MNIPITHAPRNKPTFVAAMGVVWRRPSLTGLEIAWRWLGILPLLAILVWQGPHLRQDVASNRGALEAVTVFQPAAAVRSLSATASALAAAGKPLLPWLIVIALPAWCVAAGFGRTAVWRRLHPGLHRRVGAVMALGVLRLLALLAALAVWVWTIDLAIHTAITAPVGRAQDPNLVLFCGIVIVSTLYLFMLWAVTGWMLEAAPFLAMQRNLGAAASLHRAVGLASIRARLIETNLVMGIVRVALLVLAMVFSACPLPFESVETPAFLAVWWTGVALAYFVASDYFKVVRSAVYLDQLDACATERNPVSSSADLAS